MSFARSRSRGFHGVTGRVKAALVLAGTVPVAGVSQQPANAAPSLVFDQVTVIDVEQGKHLPAQRVIITGNRIQAVGPADQIRIPSGAHVVAAQGKFLIPGLWDMHTHPNPPHQILYYEMPIAFGVTGIRDAAAGTHNLWPIDSLMRWRDEILDGTRVGPPRQLFAMKLSLSTLEDSTAIASIKALGVNALKLYPFSFANAAAARRTGLPFGGHVNGETAIAASIANAKRIGMRSSPQRAVSAIEASDSGMSIMDHVATAGDLNERCLLSQATVERCQPVADRFRQNGTWWVPTLTMRGHARMAPSEVGTPSDSVFGRLRKVVERFWSGSAPRGNWLLGTTKSDDVPPSRRFLSVAQRVGLPMLAGTDAGAHPTALSGVALHAELGVYVAEGMTPVEALRTATLYPAQLLRGTDSLGTVAPGKLADLVLLDADPLMDITNTTTIRAVVANGRYYDRAALDRLLVKVQAAVGRVP